MFFIGDVSRKIAVYYNLEFNRYTAVFKTIVVLVYVVFICFFFKEYNKFKVVRKFILLFLSLVIVFIFGQITLKTSRSLLEGINGNVLFLSRLLYWPLTLTAFFPLITSKKYKNNHLSFFTFLFILNVFLILIGFFFDINLFKTYMNSTRFGFMGIYNTSNQISYYFILFVLYYYYKAFFKLENILMFYLVLLSSFFIGTKKVYFFLMILFVYHFLKFKLYKKKEFYVVFSILTSNALFFSSTLKTFFISKFSIFIDIYYDSGLLTSITSLRDRLLIKTYHETVSSWRLPNYFIGGPSFSEIRSEFGIIDLYVFFGFFGIYAYYYYFVVYYRCTNFNKFYLFILISIGVTAFFSSGFLTDANQPLPFLLISGYFIKEVKSSIS